MGRHDFPQARHRVVGAPDRLQFQSGLNLGAFAHRRGGRNELVGADRLVVALEILEQVGDGHRGQIVIGAQEQSETQIDQGGQFVALPGSRAAQAVERLGGAVLGVADHRRERLARRQIRHRAHDQGMARNEAIEVGVDFLRAFDVVVAGEEARVGVGEPQGVLVGVIGRLQTALRLGRIAEQIGDQAGMIIAKHGDAGLAHPVERLERMAQIEGAGIAPGAQQRRRHVVRLARFAGAQLRARGDELPLRDGAHGQSQTRQTVVGVARDQAIGQRKPVGDVSVGQSGGESALDEIRISRIGAQGLAEIHRGRGRVAIGAGDQRRQIIAGLAVADPHERGIRRRSGRLGRRRADREKRARRQKRVEEPSPGAGQRKLDWHDRDFPSQNPPSDEGDAATNGRPSRRNDPREKWRFRAAGAMGATAAPTYRDNSARRRPPAASSRCFARDP